MTEIKPLRQMAEEFSREKNVKVEIVPIPFSELQTKFQIASPAGLGPDLITGPHNWVGPFAIAKLITPIGPYLADKKSPAQFHPKAIEGLTLNGKLYGLPFSIEAIALIYNRNLLQSPPKTFEEIVRQARSLTRAQTPEQWGFLFEVNNFYFAWPFFAAKGVTIFGKTPQGYDYNAVGLDSDMAVQASLMLRDLVEKERLIPSGINTDMVNGLFQEGRVAMVLNGPWVLGKLRESGLPYGVSRIPPFANGQTPQPFLGVQGVFLNRRSRIKKAAFEFAQYLNTKKGQLALFAAGGRIPARMDALRQVSSDPDIRAFAESAQNAAAIPNIPAMTQVWPFMEQALKLINSGKADPATVLRRYAGQIRDAIRNMME